jgi:hypothetical protein
VHLDEHWTLPPPSAKCVRQEYYTETLGKYFFGPNCLYYVMETTFSQEHPACRCIVESTQLECKQWIQSFPQNAAAHFWLSCMCISVYRTLVASPFALAARTSSRCRTAACHDQSHDPANSLPRILSGTRFCRTRCLREALSRFHIPCN